MSEQDYLIAKASRNMEDWKEGRRRAFRDPAFLAGAGLGVGGSAAMLHGATGSRIAPVNAAERAARAEGKTGWAAIKPALKKVPKRYVGGAAAVVPGLTMMNMRNVKHKKDVAAGR